MEPTNENTQTQPETPEQTPAAEPTQTPESTPEDNKTIPYDRFKAVNDRAKSYEQTFKELGLDGVDSLKEVIAAHKQLQEAEEERKRGEMTELEQLRADLATKETAYGELTTQLEQLQKQSEADKINAEFVKQAQAANITYLDDAKALADLSAVKFEDGKVSGVEDVIKSLIENKPFLIAQKKEQKQVGGPTNPTKDPQKTSEQLLAEAAAKAKKSGKTEDMAAYSLLKRELGL